MVAKSYIAQNLNELNRLYNQAQTYKKQLYYSKLALLELCGWIEESMDDVIKRSASRSLSDSRLRGHVDGVIKRTYGFEYQRHFEKMLIAVGGAVLVQNLEKKINVAKYHQLSSELGNLKTRRHSEAHTHLKGVTRVVDSPSVTIGRFEKVYEGLKDIESVIKQLGY